MTHEGLGASRHGFSAAALAATVGFMAFLVADAEQGGLTAIQGFFLAVGATLLVVGLVRLATFLGSSRGDAYSETRLPSELHRATARSNELCAACKHPL